MSASRSLPVFPVVPAVAACILIVAACFKLPAGGDDSAANAPRPDILLVTVDTLRADALPFYGSARDTAPQLAKRVADGIVFDRAYSVSSWTVPSVSTLTTGVLPPSHGAIHGLHADQGAAIQERIPEEMVTLAEVMRDAGYRTVGVTANGHLKEKYGFAAGFDRYACLGFSGTAEHVNAKLLEWRAFIEDSDQPVFVWLHYIDPHWAYIRRDPWFSEYAPNASAKDLAIIPLIAETWPELPGPVYDRPMEFLHLARALYDSENNYWDVEFAELLGEVPRLASAAMLFTSDHGEEFMDHGSVHHGVNLGAATVRIPLVMWPPTSIGEATREDRVVSLVDVPPTLVAWAGAEAPDHWQGVDLLDASVDTERPALSFLDRVLADKRFQSVSLGRWRLIMEDGRNPPKLFDIRIDPMERRDLARAHPDEVARLKAVFEEAVQVLPPAPENGRAVAVDPEELELLRALGYANRTRD
jgi:choline-sulfatase